MINRELFIHLSIHPTSPSYQNLGFAAVIILSMMSSEQKSYGDRAPPCAPWPVDLKLTHLDWNPEATLIHFQGQYLTICELDYNSLQGEIQNSPKSQAAVDIGEFCLVEDLTSARWYRGRVQNQKKDSYDVFLIDHGNILTVDEAHISSCSNDLFILPAKIVCGFLSSVLLLPGCCRTVVEQYFANLVGRNITGYIQALLPHKVLLLESPDINNDLVCHGFGRHVDTDTFLLLVEMLTEAPLKQNIEPAPDLLMEKQRGQEFFLKPTSLQGYEDILSSCRPRLKCGSHATVRVTAAVKPGLFYCQMTDKESELNELSSKLAAACELKAKVNQLRTPDNLSVLCSVKGKDEKWYRGLIQHLPVNSFVRVLFVDYGFFESVKVENIHKLPPDFCSTPIMAFPCALSCVDNEGEDIKSKQLCFLRTSLLGGILEIMINKYKPEQHLYHVTILNAKERVHPAPIKKSPNTKSEKEQSLLQNGHLYYETIMRKELGKTLEDEEIQVGSVFSGYVEHVQNPNQFWVRSERRNAEFEEMMAKMAEHFSKLALDEDIMENPEPGMLCCAVYEEDMHYYRGVVVDLLEHGAEVLFVDFGNIGKVPHNLIKKIPAEFAGKSAFALCCSLVDVMPTDEFWTCSSTDSFRRLSSNKVLQVHVIQMRRNKFDVDLYYKERGNDGDQSLSELLISTNQAHYLKNISAQQFMDQREKHNLPKHKVKTQKNQPLLNTKASENWNEQQEEEEAASKDETEKPKEAISLKAFNIKPGCEFSVCCPLVNMPSDFWCQRLDKVPALEALMRRLQEHYLAKTVPLQPEALCCAVKPPHNEKWCRGIVAERRNGRAKVILADFGTSLDVSEESLQGLLPEYCVLEGQAFRCSLYNVIEPVARGWTRDATELLRTFIDDSRGSLKCNVVSQLNVKNKGLCNVVHLRNTESKQSVSDLLVENSLAQVVTGTPSPAVIPESFVYSSYNLAEGSEEQVLVTHVNSYFEVFCQLEKNSAVVDELAVNISEVQKVAQAENPENVVEKLCLAKYLDGLWYRGIASSAQSPSHVCVTFVDYGNTMIAEKKHVVFIPRDSTELLHTPMQALRFCLSGVPPGLIYANVKDWLDTAVLNKLVKVLVVAKVGDGSFEVELFDGDVSVNDGLKELVQSLAPKPKTAVTFKISGKKILENANPRISLNPNTQKKKNCQNKSNTSGPKTQKGRVKSPQSKKPNKVTKKSWRSTPGPQTISAIQVNKEHSSLPAIQLTKGSKLKCFASHIDSRSSFFLQRSNDEANVLQMAEALNSSAFRETLEPCTSIPLKAEDLVLAEYEEDGALYRAVVKEDVDICTFNIEFVDFGNTAIVGKEKMFLMPKDNICKPRYSIACTLNDCSAFDNNAAFADAVKDKPLMVEFVCYRNSQWEVKVEIVDATTSVPVETTSQKETDTAPKEIDVVPKVKSSTETKPNTKRHFKTKRGTRAAKKTIFGVSKDLLRPFFPPKIQSGDTDIGLLLSVQSNGNFYLRLDKSEESLAVLDTLIAVNVHKCESVQTKEIQEGLNCLVQEPKSGLWRRAVVKDISHNTCLVHLLDYGKMETVSKSTLRQMMGYLRTIPPFAWHCRLNDQRVCEQDGQTYHQALKAIEGNKVKFTFVEMSRILQLWFVEMVMDEVLLKHHVSNMVKETEPDCLEKRECVPERKLPQKLAFAPVELNKEYSGFAAAVTTPFEFCVILEDLHLMSQVSILLDDLQDEQQPLPQAHLVPRTGCLFKSDWRTKWCRAEILNADGALTLNLVDYGHTECLPYADHAKLKTLPDGAGELPKVTYPCVLNAVRPAGAHERWTDEAAVFFQQCLDQKNLRIIFREEVSACRWKVDVLANEVHVAKQLVDAGHGSYTDVMLGLRFQEQSLSSSPGHQSEECDEDPEEGSRTLEKFEQIKVESNLCMMS
ncbi:tudor domain-containing protein 15 [Eucyclogobius newberryi]|uniref:tudor domain-containing protein 15 n=1 Tax=Eucyclogobius newberryi TaxID=166745 RepID=UPI003B5CBA18